MKAINKHCLKDKLRDSVYENLIVEKIHDQGQQKECEIGLTI